MLIPIDRTTIRRNPRAGSTISYVAGRATTKEIIVKDKIRSTYLILPKQRVLIHEEFKIEENDSYNKIVEYAVEEIYHAPQPYFFYEYQDIDLSCECGWIGKRHDLVENYSDYCSEHCPKCGDAVNYTFETLTDKELEGLANND